MDAPQSEDRHAGRIAARGHRRRAGRGLYDESANCHRQAGDRKGNTRLANQLRDLEWQKAEELAVAGRWAAQHGPLLAQTPGGGVFLTSQSEPADKRVVTILDGWRVQVWNSENGAAVSGPLKHSQRVRNMQMSPDGRSLAVGCQDGS